MAGNLTRHSGLPGIKQRLAPAREIGDSGGVPTPSPKPFELPMRRAAVSALLLAFVAAAAVTVVGREGHAARDAASPIVTGSIGARDELVVYELPSSAYCRLFRRDVVPAFERSTRARTLPMRFVDLSAEGATEAGLEAPVTTVPTVVLLRDGREAGRITGYTGPENFFHLVNHMMGPAE